MPSRAVKGASTGSQARKSNWHKYRALRKIVFAVLRRFPDVEIKIRHHWAPNVIIKLNVLRHKGYWFHGKAREKGVMASFSRLLKPGQTVVEVGGHIGYTTIHLANLVGSEGTVRVFEPSPDNLKYIIGNTNSLSQVEVISAGISDTSGVASFYVENLTGQNSSLIFDYKNFSDSRANAFSAEAYHTIEIETVTMDAYLHEENLKPDLIKIDIEGAELLALRGMHHCLYEIRPVMMVEVTNDESEVMRVFDRARYVAYDSDLRPLTGQGRIGPNRFFVPEEKVLALGLSPGS